LVERGPEKAGVGGSIPSLATNNFNNLQIAKYVQKSSREQYAYIWLLNIRGFAHCGSRIFQVPALCHWFKRYVAAPASHSVPSF
jgi:hypothetical protein